ncbi:hypothetical protein Tco_0925188, partial [Tanacetum coccineum]
MEHANRGNKLTTHTDYALWEVIVNGDATCYWHSAILRMQRPYEKQSRPGEVTLLENAGHQGIRGIEMEMLQEGLLKKTSQPLLNGPVQSQGFIKFKTMRPSFEQNKPSYAKINFVKLDENTRKSVIEQHTYRQAENLRKSQSPRNNRRNWNEMMTQKLGNGFEFIKKSCFVCGSFNNLIKDCDFHDKKIVEKLVLNNKGRVTGQREIRPQSSPRAATLISDARPINIVAPKSKVNDALPKTYSYFKAHLPVKMTFNQKSAAKTNNLNEKVKTARVNNVTTDEPKAVVSTAKGKRENVVKFLACWIWRPTGKVIDHISKDSGSYMPKR